MRSRSPLRVGIIGANPDYGWGSGAHVPVIQQLPDFVLQGVCTTREESAKRAAAAFHAPLFFTSADALIQHPEIDLVSVCVKAPFHYQISRAALHAGKHVYCEWPLTIDVAKAQDLAKLAARSDAKAMIGLHLRGAPALRQAARLLAEGFVGERYSVTLTARLFGPVMRSMATLAGGTTLLSIYGGHLLDALDYYFGGIADISTQSAIHLPPVDENGMPFDRDAADHLQFHGVLQGGGLFNVDLAGFSVTDMGSRWRIDGPEGSLILSNRDAGLPAIESLVLHGARRGAPLAPIAIAPEFECAAIPAEPDRYPAYPGSFASREALSSIGNLYTELAAAIRADTPVAPDFQRAADIQAMLAETSAASARSTLHPAGAET